MKLVRAIEKHKTVLETKSLWSFGFSHLLQILCVIVILSITLTNAAPLDDSSNAQILKYESDNIGIDGYRFS